MSTNLTIKITGRHPEKKKKSCYSLYVRILDHSRDFREKKEYGFFQIPYFSALFILLP